VIRGQAGLGAPRSLRGCPTACHYRLQEVAVHAGDYFEFDIFGADRFAFAGYWLPTDAPGLGVRVNEAEAARHPFQQEVLQSAVYAGDGAVLDW